MWPFVQRNSFLDPTFSDQDMTALWELVLAGRAEGLG